MTRRTEGGLYVIRTDHQKLWWMVTVFGGFCVGLAAVAWLFVWLMLV